MKLITMNSTNHYNGRNGWKADVLCCHQTGGTSAEAALKWYMNPNSNCCPTFVVDVDGTVYQLISLDNAPYSNGTRTQPGTALYYGLATSKLVRERKTNANYFTYSVEFVHCQYGDITDAQVQAAIEIVRDMLIPDLKKNGVTPKIDREHIIGHCEVDPVTRAFCPGKNFPYQRIIDGVMGKPTVSPIPTVTPSAGDKVESINYIMQSVGQAAIRSNTARNEPNPQRCKKGAYYAFDQKITKANGEIWLRHAGISLYSMYRDGGYLFRKEGTYTRYKTTDALKVRSEPSLSGTKINQFCAGAYIFVFDEKPIPADKFNWVKVIAGDSIGYCASEYLSKI